MKTRSGRERDVGRVEQSGRVDAADDRDAELGQPALDGGDFGPALESATAAR